MLLIAIHENVMMRNRSIWLNQALSIHLNLGEKKMLQSFIH